MLIDLITLYIAIIYLGGSYVIFTFAIFCLGIQCVKSRGRSREDRVRYNITVDLA